MRLAGIIGHPVAHSLSPVFQAAAFRECGLDVGYEAWDTPPEALAGRVVSLTDAKYLGANVTIPHKERVIPLLDELGGQSARVGAVNTIVNRGGRLYGFNTDGPGFVSSLRNEASFQPGGKRILLLGAGGAARGIAFALAEARAAEVSIFNRTHTRAARLAADVSAFGGSVSAPGELTALDRYDCVVNCTSLGMHGAPGGATDLPCDVRVLRSDTLVVDIVYTPAETPFLRAAREAGLRTLPGLPMLIHQGALAFELWTGVHAPVDVMHEAARKALADRESRALARGRTT